jgi:hypothetical protein
VIEFAKQGFLKTRYLREDPEKFIASIMALTVGELSFPAKLIIHYQLCGGTILELGTEWHHQQ